MVFIDLWDEAYTLVCCRALEEGDVSLDDDEIIERFATEIYRDLCAEHGIKPDPEYL